MLPGPGLYEAIFVCVFVYLVKNFFLEFLWDSPRIQVEKEYIYKRLWKNFSGKFLYALGILKWNWFFEKLPLKKFSGEKFMTLEIGELYELCEVYT